MAKLKKTDEAIQIILMNCKLYSIDDDDGVICYGNKTFRAYSKGFKLLVRKLYRDNTGRSLSEPQVKEVIEEVASIATGSDPAFVFTRIGRDDSGTILINPVWPDGKIIAIYPGWFNVLDRSDGNFTYNKKQVLFVDGHGMKPLPKPEEGKGCLLDLRRFLLCSGDDEQFLLILSFMVSCFFYEGPFPILVIVAEGGSGKSLKIRFIKSIIDPHGVMLISPPKSVEDVYSSATTSHLLCYDNISKIDGTLSDCFCRLSTGGGVMGRKLYTDNEIFYYEAKRPVAVNSIVDVFHRDDILQRALHLLLEPIKPEDRREEEELIQDFNSHLPGILHDLYSLVADVLKKLPAIEIDEPTRMVNLCRIGEAVALTLGYEQGHFMKIYRNNQNLSHEAVIESSAIGPVIKRWIDTKGGYFKGTATELLEELNVFSPESAKSRYWPKNAVTFSNQLRRIGQNFRAIGYRVEFDRDTTTTNRTRLITFQKGGVNDDSLPF